MEEKVFHPTEIPGYEGNEGKRALAELISRLRYDEQAKLFGYYEQATLRNAEKDENQLCRINLARDGRTLVGQIKSVQVWLGHMFHRYRKYMEHELGEDREG